MADFIIHFIGGVFATLAVLGLGFGFLQGRKAKRLDEQMKKDREKVVQTLMESAHELAKKEVDSKPIDDLIAESNKRLSARMANKSSKE